MAEKAHKPTLQVTKPLTVVNEGRLHTPYLFKREVPTEAACSVGVDAELDDLEQLLRYLVGGTRDAEGCQPRETKTSRTPARGRVATRSHPRGGSGEKRRRLGNL